MKFSLIGVAIGGALGIFASPAFAVTYNDLDFYGAYTVTVTNVSAKNTSARTISGAEAPTINLTGGLPGGTVLVGSQKPGNPTNYFEMENLITNGGTGYANSDASGLLLTVDPASYMTSNRTAGTETADINLDFTFYNANHVAIGSVGDTAIATIKYNSDVDNLCWQNSLGTGGIIGSLGTVVSETSFGSCGSPGSGTVKNGGEQIKIDLAGTYYDVNLYDWNDWDEQPKISFQKVPEPASLAMLAASLLGLGFVVARQRRIKAEPI